MKMLNSLTGIRGIAALWVLLFHIQDHLSFNFINFGLFLPLIQKGYLAVDAFFILSGFIISYVHQAEFRNFSNKSIGIFFRFLILRLARLYPVHITILLIYGVMYIVSTQLMHTLPEHPESFSLISFLLNLLLIHAWGFYKTVSWNAPSWSISVEWFAYICFPFLANFFARLQTKSTNVLLIILCLALLYGAYKSTSSTSINWTVGLGLIRVFFEFSIGCLLLNLFKLIQTSEYKKQNSHYVFNALTITSYLTAVILIYCKGNDILIVSCYSIATLSLSMCTGFVEWIFSNRFMTYLGTISFSIYMIHQLPLTLYSKINAIIPKSIFHNNFFTPIYLFVVVLSVILAGSFTYHLIEVPSRNFIRRRLDSFAFMSKAG